MRDARQKVNQVENDFLKVIWRVYSIHIHEDCMISKWKNLDFKFVY